jgi:hypothetical protein
MYSEWTLRDVHREHHWGQTRYLHGRLRFVRSKRDRNVSCSTVCAVHGHCAMFTVNATEDRLATYTGAIVSFVPKGIEMYHLVQYVQYMDTARIHRERHWGQTRYLHGRHRFVRSKRHRNVSCSTVCAVHGHCAMFTVNATEDRLATYTGVSVLLVPKGIEMYHQHCMCRPPRSLQDVYLGPQYLPVRPPWSHHR